ncbi:AraC family transcriptional regulator [Luteolibacter sp. LG18]|uniref:AraC family transcriptional regulator n=1 Tax=Luteolibacter sp. LG18 TaxID=2819286 RepID=UPI002B2E81BA|nr:hypothetical protein llg_28190 [Luteolibacter sp. LG18]
MRGAVEYLLGHYTQSLELPELAERCGLSPKGLRGQFKRFMGITPMECLIRIRVEKAKRLLAGTNTPIKDIAVEVGFYDHSSLNRHFIRLAGMPPSIYRDQKHAEILSKFGVLTEGAGARQVV